MELLLNTLVGKKVTVYSGEQNSDTGVLDAFDTQWVRLKMNNKGYLYLNVFRIRLIKPV